MIKIFYKNKFIQLSENIADNNSLTKISFSNEELVKNELNIFLDTNNSDCLNIYYIKESDFLKFFNTYFTFIRAAGGIISDTDKRVIMIERLGYIDLPKGKVEINENIKTAAIREVCEECGIKQNELTKVNEFDKTYHIYPYKGRYALKETSWFTMLYTGNFCFAPQIEEDISSVFMVDENKIEKYFEKTYSTLIELLTKYLKTNN